MLLLLDFQAWTSAMKYVTRTLYSRTGSGLHTLTDLLDLPVTLRYIVFQRALFFICFHTFYHCFTWKFQTVLIVI
jgi:hypothetical protein